MKKRTDFPTGWDERTIPEVDEPMIWSEEGLDGHDLKRIRLANKFFLEVIQQKTQTMLPKIIATFRWSEFQLTVKDIAPLIGVSANGYHPMEADLGDRQIQFHTYEYLLEFLETRGISRGIREQILDLLTMPRYFEQENPGEGNAYEKPITLLNVIDNVRKGEAPAFDLTDMIAYYHRIGYDIGHPEMLERRKGIWDDAHSRGYDGTLPKACEIFEVVDAAYPGDTGVDKKMNTLRTEEGVGIWTSARRTLYRSLDVEEPLGQLLTAMEMDLATHWQWDDTEDKDKPVKPMTLTAEALSTVYGIDPLPSSRLVQTELVDWEDIEHVAAKLIPSGKRKQFKKDWQAAYETECERYSFPNESVAAMAGHGYNTRNVADILGLKIDEDRRQKREDEREQRDRPEAVIRTIMLFNRQSGQVAIEGLLRVLARDEDHYQELRMLYEIERERYYKRQGEKLHGDGMHMRLLRELANVTTKDLALRFAPVKDRKNPTKLRKFETDVIQKVERQEITDPRVTFEKISPILEEAIAKEKDRVLEAIEKFDDFPEDLKEFATVRQMAKNCVTGMRGGGAAMVSDKMRNDARNDSDWLPGDLVQDMAAGNFVPPLPCARLMAKAVPETPLTKGCEVIRDWYRRFPDQLMVGCQKFAQGKPFTTPMARVLCTHIASVEANLIDFFTKRTSGITPTRGTRLLRTIEEEGCDEDDWQRVRKIMIGAENPVSSVPFLLGQELFHNGQNVRAALRAIKKKHRGTEAHSSNFKGLLYREAALFKTL
jgi:hypothetical protein